MHIVGKSCGFFKFEVTIEEKALLGLESDAHCQYEVRTKKRMDQRCSFNAPLFLYIFKKNSHIVWNPKIHSRVNKSPPLVRIGKYINPDDALLTYFSKIHINITFPFKPMFSRGLFLQLSSPKVYLYFSSVPYVPHSPPILLHLKLLIITVRSTLNSLLCTFSLLSLLPSNITVKYTYEI